MWRMHSIAIGTKAEGDQRPQDERQCLQGKEVDGRHREEARVARTGEEGLRDGFTTLSSSM